MCAIIMRLSAPPHSVSGKKRFCPICFRKNSYLILTSAILLGKEQKDRHFADMLNVFVHVLPAISGHRRQPNASVSLSCSPRPVKRTMFESHKQSSLKGDHYA